MEGENKIKDERLKMKETNIAPDHEQNSDVFPYLKLP